MAFDQTTRNRLQRFVNDARRVLEEEFTRQLQNDFGLDPNSGTVAELASLRHINDAQRETARILRDTLAHYTASGDMNAMQGLDRIVREQAFTVLNRLAALRMSARSRDDEKQFEALQAFELELIELRDTLLKLAPTYKPNHDDGVQISAAPLWPLFRHKPWQKVLKTTWEKLEKGDYDWAHLAMNYWPERVREKCKTDKSLAIAHGLEDLYIEPEAAPKKTRGRKKTGGVE